MVQTYLHIFASVEPPMQRCLSSGHIRNTSGCIALLPTIDSSIWSSQYTSATLQEPANARPLKSGNRIIKCKRYRRVRFCESKPTLRFSCTGPATTGKTQRTRGHKEQRLESSSQIFRCLKSRRIPFNSLSCGSANRSGKETIKRRTAENKRRRPTKTGVIGAERSL